MGNYMREFFSRDLEEIEMDKRLNSDITSYESSLDSNRSAFQDIICEMDALKLELNKKRLDRSSLRKIMESTMRIIENQI